MPFKLLSLYVIHVKVINDKFCHSCFHTKPLNSVPHSSPATLQPLGSHVRPVGLPQWRVAPLWAKPIVFIFPEALKIKLERLSPPKELVGESPPVLTSGFHLTSSQGLPATGKTPRSQEDTKTNKNRPLPSNSLSSKGGWGVKYFPKPRALQALRLPPHSLSPWDGDGILPIPYRLMRKWRLERTWILPRAHLTQPPQGRTQEVKDFRDTGAALGEALGGGDGE